MNKDEKYQKRLKELKPLIFSLQAAIELFGREKAKEMAELIFEKYAEERSVAPYKRLPQEKRWQVFRNHLLHNADDLEYSIEAVKSNMVKVKYLRCLFLEIFRDHDLEDFVPIYCRTDYTTAAKIDPQINFSRTQTLAEKAPYCDHCWTYKKK
jgi:hypothetical protein